MSITLSGYLRDINEEKLTPNNPEENSLFLKVIRETRSLPVFHKEESQSCAQYNYD